MVVWSLLCSEYPTSTYPPPSGLKLVGCWGFISWQHLRSYQDGYWLVTVSTHGAPQCCPIGKSGHQHHNLISPQSHYPETELTSPCPIILMQSSRLGRNKYQFYKSLLWLDWELNSRSPAAEACVPLIPPCFMSQIENSSGSVLQVSLLFSLMIDSVSPA